MMERLQVQIPTGEFSSPGSTFYADSDFSIHSTPHFTTVACKRSRSFYQKCRWQVTAKHVYTLRMQLCMKGHGACVFSSNLPPALLVEWPGFSMCYFGDMQMEWILKILPSILLGFKPATFWSWVWYSNHWVIPAPVIWNRFPVGVTVTSMT